MEQPPAESPTREGKRTAVSRPYGTPQVDLRHMLEGDVPQDQMTVFIFSIGIRKLSDLNTVTKGIHNIFSKGGTRWQGPAQLSRELVPQK